MILNLLSTNFSPHQCTVLSSHLIPQLLKPQLYLSAVHETETLEENIFHYQVISNNQTVNAANLLYRFACLHALKLSADVRVLNKNMR